MHTYACNFKRFEIQQDRQVDCTHVEMNEHDVVVRTDQLSVMVERCKRFPERLRTSAENDTVVKNGYQGKLLSMYEKYGFSETISRLGHQNFDRNTPYIVPGWSTDQKDNLSVDGFVVLISTMNLDLNHARASVSMMARSSWSLITPSKYRQGPHSSVPL